MIDLYLKIINYFGVKDRKYYTEDQIANSQPVYVIEAVILGFGLGLIINYSLESYFHGALEIKPNLETIVDQEVILGKNLSTFSTEDLFYNI